MASNLFDLSKITVKPSKRKQRKRQGPSKRMKRYSKRLKDNTPKSELWFQELWAKDNMGIDKLSLYTDLYNEPFGRYIPDVRNTGYKYIIEIDGSIHENDELVQWNDKKKDIYYTKKGYTVFRVKAYDHDNYLKVLEEIKALIKNTTRRY